MLTDSDDQKCHSCFLQVTLFGETCDWLTEPIKNWFAETVPHSVKAEFDRYIQAGDLEQTRQRIQEIEATSDNAGGFVGMYL